MWLIQNVGKDFFFFNAAIPSIYMRNNATDNQITALILFSKLIKYFTDKIISCRVITMSSVPS